MEELQLTVRVDCRDTLNIEYTPFQDLVAKQTLLITVLILLFSCGEETDDRWITDGGSAYR